MWPGLIASLRNFNHMSNARKAGGGDHSTFSPRNGRRSYLPLRQLIRTERKMALGGSDAVPLECNLDRRTTWPVSGWPSGSAIQQVTWTSHKGRINHVYQPGLTPGVPRWLLKLCVVLIISTNKGKSGACAGLFSLRDSLSSTEARARRDVTRITSRRYTMAAIIRALKGPRCSFNCSNFSGFEEEENHFAGKLFSHSSIITWRSGKQVTGTMLRTSFCHYLEKNEELRWLRT